MQRLEQGKTRNLLRAYLWESGSRNHALTSTVEQYTAINRKKRTRDPDKQCEGNPKTHNCESCICPDLHVQTRKRRTQCPKDEMVVAALGWGAELLGPTLGGSTLTLPVYFHGFGNLTPKTLRLSMHKGRDRLFLREECWKRRLPRLSCLWWRPECWLHFLFRCPHFLLFQK